MYYTWLCRLRTHYIQGQVIISQMTLPGYSKSQCVQTYSRHKAFFLGVIEEDVYAVSP